MKIITQIMILSLIILMSGCATSRGRIALENSPSTEILKSNNRVVFINSVVDNRIFEIEPSKPSIPSLKNGEINDDNITSLAIARKRNSFGKALGDILLKDGQTVCSIIKSNTEQALLEKGYEIIYNKSRVTNDTIVIDVDVRQFWSWLNIGFWSLTISTEIGADIKVSKKEKKEMIHLISSDSFQTAMGSNWITVMKQALKNYRLELKSRF
ncbi:hypothetical protein N9X61_03615 [Sulfurimonas sp.]|nr:hypothetical protein [Sulfurimonas sp.]